MAEPPKPDPKAQREARLAAALRSNLRRRKTQARGREAAPEPDRAEMAVPSAAPKPRDA